MQDHLLGRLGSDSAQINGGNLVDDFVTDLRVGLVSHRLFDRDLRVVIFLQVVFDNGAHAGKGGAAGLAVDADTNVHFRAIARFGGTR